MRSQCGRQLGAPSIAWIPNHIMADENTLLRVGIAGYGVVGKRRRQFIDLHPQMKTIAVCDRKFNEEGMFEDGVTYHENYQQLLSQHLDVVFVCLTNDLAPEATIAGLKTGLHVFCEKPPGRDIADIARVIACEKKRPNQKLKYGFNHRYHDSVRDALDAIGSGEWGEIINLRGLYGKSAIINFESDWRTKREIAGGGILLDQGIHMVDLLRLFAGEFKDIFSFVSNSHWNHDVEDNAYAILRTEDGKVAMLHSSATQWRHRFSLEITTEEGSLTLSGILSGSKSYGTETLTLARKNDGAGQIPDEETIRYDEDNSWSDEITEFADAILTDKPVTSGSSHDALKTMHLVYRIYAADQAWSERWGLSDEIPDLG